VISTGISGITELVEHMTDGILVAERDFQAIADATETLLLQRELRKRLGENGGTKVLGRFALDASAGREHEILSHAGRQAHAQTGGAVMPEGALYSRSAHG